MTRFGRIKPIRGFYVAHLIAAVGTTFNIFEAVWAKNRTNYLPNAEQMHYVL